MSTTIEIPGGQAMFRAVSSLTARQRNAIAAEAYGINRDGPASKDEFLAATRAQELLTVTLLESWTFDQPLPTLDTLADLPADVYDALNAGTVQAQKDSPKFGPEGSLDPDSPIAPSIA